MATAVSESGISHAPASHLTDRPLVLFDGHCGLCDGFVTWLLARDAGARLRFSTLQGETASALEVERPESVLLIEGGSVYDRSEAVIRAVAILGGPYRAVNILRVVPRLLRDRVYDAIARRRYGWFGRHDHCRVPSDEERSRFLP